MSPLFLLLRLDGLGSRLLLHEKLSLDNLEHLVNETKTKAVSTWTDNLERIETYMTGRLMMVTAFHSSAFSGRMPNRLCRIGV